VFTVNLTSRVIVNEKLTSELFYLYLIVGLKLDPPPHANATGNDMDEDDETDAPSMTYEETAAEAAARRHREAEAIEAEDAEAALAAARRQHEAEATQAATRRQHEADAALAATLRQHEADAALAATLRQHEDAKAALAAARRQVEDEAARRQHKAEAAAEAAARRQHEAKVAKEQKHLAKVIDDKQMDDINRKKRDLIDLPDREVEHEAGQAPSPRKHANHSDLYDSIAAVVHHQPHEKYQEGKPKAVPGPKNHPSPKKSAVSLKKHGAKKSPRSKTVTRNSPAKNSSMLNKAGTALRVAFDAATGAIPCLEDANEKRHYLQDREVTLNLDDLESISMMDDDNLFNLASAKANNKSNDEVQLDGQLCLQAENPWAFASQEVANKEPMPPPEPIYMPHRRNKPKAVSRDEVSLSEVTAASIGSGRSIATRSMTRKKQN
jgi:hypothetical protein